MSASTAHAVLLRSETSEDIAALRPAGVQGLTTLPPGVFIGRTVSETLRRLPSQLPIIDDLLDGGLPRGRVSELVGPQSSGKTSLLIAFLAAATQRSEVTAYVDLADSLHPQSFAAAGVDLERLLWVRPPSLKDAVRCTEIILQAGGFAAVALDFGNRLSVIGHRYATDRSRLNAHRLPITDHRSPTITTSHQSPTTSHFRLNVWPRLARAAERAHAALIVLAPQRVTGSVAMLGIETRVHKTLWRHGAWPLFDGFDLSVTVARSKLGPPGRTERWLVASG
jgi:hypothetical protein